VTKFLRNWELWLALAFLVLGFAALIVRENYALLCVSCFFCGLFAGKMQYARDEVKYQAVYGYMSDEDLGEGFHAT